MLHLDDDWSRVDCNIKATFKLIFKKEYNKITKQQYSKTIFNVCFKQTNQIYALNIKQIFLHFLLPSNLFWKLIFARKQKKCEPIEMKKMFEMKSAFS